MSTAQLVRDELEQRPWLDVEGFGEGFEQLGVDALDGIAAEYPHSSGARDTGFSGEAVGGIPALPRHVWSKMPSDHVVTIR